MQKFIIAIVCLAILAGCQSPTETQRGDEGPEYVFRFAMKNLQIVFKTTMRRLLRKK